MVRRTEPLTGLLEELGRGHREGAFSANSGRYPWRMEEPATQRRSHHHFAWVRVGVPLAAAAAVAVLFVGPSLFNTGNVHEVSEVAQPVIAPVSPVVAEEEPVLVEEPATTTSEAVDCDYNGDGRIDGADIQAFLERAKAGDSKDVDMETEFLRRCLLGGE